jgi:hypothetical protein
MENDQTLTDKEMRRFYAAQALCGQLANDKLNEKLICIRAFRLADMMMKAERGELTMESQREEPAA